MKALAKTVREILYSGDQFLIPFFQRNYSWKLEHWQRLWDDVRTLADKSPTRVHFMGPLVCMLNISNAMPGEVPEYQLIDGQQRLTTITLLLTALRDLANCNQLPSLAEEITESYLIQKHKKGLKRYKLLPRVGDREILIAVIEGNSLEQSRRIGIVRAYRFLRAAAERWIADDPPKRITQLAAAVTSRLSLVVITVEGENPYDIFDSLNSAGLPLQQSDLIRNFTFMKIPLEDQEDFDRKHWKPFEEILRDDEGDDEQNAKLLTSFYRDYLMRNGEYSRKNETFIDFKTQFKELPDVKVEDLVGNLKTYARFELLLRRVSKADNPKLDEVLDRLYQLDVATANPLILHLLAQHDDENLTTNELLDCLTDIESFVIRRSIAGESTRGYHEMFPAAIKAIRESAHTDLRTYLIKRGWPDDTTFESQLQSFSIYRRERKKAKQILKRLEESFGHKEGPQFDDLTIEHVLPQTITGGKNSRKWQEMLGEDWVRLHETWVHTLGNLTLTGYNVELSNSSFATKKKEYARSKVELNKYFHDLETWNSKQIQIRAQKLAKQVARLWPCPAETEYIPANTSFDTVFDVPDSTDLKAIQSEYWQQFMAKLGTVALELQPKAIEDKPWLEFPTERSACFFATVIDPEEASINVELAFRGRYAKWSLAILRQEEDAIEKELGNQIEWEDDAPITKAALYLDSAQPLNRADWDRQHAWLATKLIELKRSLTPRIWKPESEAFDRKNTMLNFWTRLNGRMTQKDSSIEMPAPNAKSYVDVEIRKGLSIALQIDPNENWIWAGLQFEGQKAFDQMKTLTPELEKFAAEHGWKLWTEDEADDYRYAGVYRFANLDRKDHWNDYQEWLLSVVENTRAMVLRHS
jgi:uncharacterized protein with ParB-like and HNH nuclease domain